MSFIQVEQAHVILLRFYINKTQLWFVKLFAKVLTIELQTTFDIPCKVIYIAVTIFHVFYIQQS